MEQPRHEPSAQLLAGEDGYRLVLGFTLTGNETDPEFHTLVTWQQAAVEQARLMVNTLALVGFQPEPGEVVMERTENGTWHRPEATPPPAQASSAVSHIQAVLQREAPAPVEEVAPDPVLRALMNGAAPQVNRQLAEALSRALPERERIGLVEGLGGTAKEVYTWLMAQRQDNPTLFFTVGEISKATGFTAHSVSTRLSDLESASLVQRGHKQLSGKHKRWTAYRALVEERAMARS